MEHLILASSVAQSVSNPEENLSATIELLTEAFQGGNWFAAGAILIMLATWFSGKWIQDKRWLPFVAAGIGMLASVATSALGGAPWYVAIYKGLLTGGSATMFWSMAGKKYLPAWDRPADEGTSDVKDGPTEGS